MLPPAGCLIPPTPPPLFRCESPIAPDTSLFIYAASSRYSLPDPKLAPALLISPFTPLECAYLEDKAVNDLQEISVAARQIFEDILCSAKLLLC